MNLSNTYGVFPNVKQSLSKLKLFFPQIFTIYNVLKEMTTIEYSTETDVFSPDILISKTLWQKHF